MMDASRLPFLPFIYGRVAHLLALLILPSTNTITRAQIALASVVGTT